MKTYTEAEAYDRFVKARQRAEKLEYAWKVAYFLERGHWPGEKDSSE